MKEKRIRSLSVDFVSFPMICFIQIHYTHKIYNIIWYFRPITLFSRIYLLLNIFLILLTFRSYLFLLMDAIVFSFCILLLLKLSKKKKWNKNRKYEIDTKNTPSHSVSLIHFNWNELMIRMVNDDQITHTYKKKQKQLQSRTLYSRNKTKAYYKIIIIIYQLNTHTHQR